MDIPALGRIAGMDVPALCYERIHHLLVQLFVIALTSPHQDGLSVHSPCLQHFNRLRCLLEDNVGIGLATAFVPIHLIIDCDPVEQKRHKIRTRVNLTCPIFFSSHSIRRRHQIGGSSALQSQYKALWPGCLLTHPFIGFSHIFISISCLFVAKQSLSSDLLIFRCSLTSSIKICLSRAFDSSSDSA